MPDFCVKESFRSYSSIYIYLQCECECACAFECDGAENDGAGADTGGK